MQHTHQLLPAKREPGAIAYCRVSDQRQVKSDGSLTRQADDARQYASRNGYRLIRVFIEEGETAKTDNRTVLQQMLRYCAENASEIDVLIVPKVDRLSRVVYDHHSLKRTLLKSGVRLESVSERLDDSPSGRFMENMLAATAQFDNEVRAERCKGGMIDGVHSGRWMWAAPYGFGNVKLDGMRPNIAPREPEASLVRQAFTLVDADVHPAAVYKQLSAKGLKISRSAFFSMLRNKIYIGVISAFGMEVTGTYPLVPIVSEDVFYRVQANLKKNQNGSIRISVDLRVDFPLRGTIICACGERMTASWSAGRRQSYPYYHCQHCNRLRRRAGDIHTQFVDRLNDYCVASEYIDTFATRLETEWEARMVTVRARKNELQQVRGRFEEQRKIIGEKVVAGVLPDDLAKEQLDSLSVKISEVGKEIDKLSYTAPDAGPSIEFAKKWLDRPGDFWLDALPEERLALQSALLPTGLIYTPESHFRTQEIWLLEQTKGIITGKNPEWWTTDVLSRTLELFKKVQHQCAV